MIVPCGITATLAEEERKNLYSKCEELGKALEASGVRIKGDYRDNYSPGWKFNHWELKVRNSLLNILPTFELNKITLLY